MTYEQTDRLNLRISDGTDQFDYVDDIAGNFRNIDASVVTNSGPNTMSATSASDLVLLLRAFLSQNANIIEVRDSTNNVIFAVGASGNFGRLSQFSGWTQFQPTMTYVDGSSVRDQLGTGGSILGWWRYVDKYTIALNYNVVTGTDSSLSAHDGAVEFGLPSGAQVAGNVEQWGPAKLYNPAAPSGFCLGQCAALHSTQTVRVYLPNSYVSGGSAQQFGTGSAKIPTDYGLGPSSNMRFGIPMLEVTNLPDGA